jgi:hypothetical protein
MRKHIFQLLTSPSGSVVFEREYSDVLTRAVALGYTLPSLSQQVKQNKLLKDLKTANVWGNLDVFYMFATDGNNLFATLNWRNPNIAQSTLVNSPTFTQNQGFAGNGTSSYINTNYNPSTFVSPKYLVNDASLGWHKRTTGTISTSRNIVSVASGRINIVNANSAFQYHNVTGQNSVGMNFSTTGFALANKTASLAGTNYIGNTTPINYTSLLNDVLPASNVLLLSSNGSVNFSDAQLSYFFAGANLSASANSLFTAFSTYLNSI